MFRCLIAVCFIFSLAACGGSDDGGPQVTPTTPPSPSPSPSPTASPSPSPSPSPSGFEGVWYFEEMYDESGETFTEASLEVIDEDNQVVEYQCGTRGFYPLERNTRQITDGNAVYVSYYGEMADEVYTIENDQLTITRTFEFNGEQESFTVVFDRLPAIPESCDLPAFNIYSVSPSTVSQDGETSLTIEYEYQVQSNFDVSLLLSYSSSDTDSNAVFDQTILDNAISDGGVYSGSYTFTYTNDQTGGGQSLVLTPIIKYLVSQTDNSSDSLLADQERFIIPIEGN